MKMTFPKVEDYADKCICLIETMYEKSIDEFLDQINIYDVYDGEEVIFECEELIVTL